MSLEDVLSKLSKSTREKVLDAQALQVVRVPTASYGINQALNGGLVSGRITTWFGSKSSGKSVQCYQIIAEAQRRGEVCLIVDAEDSYMDEWAVRLGVDTERLIVVREKAISDVTDIVVDHINAGVQTVVVDSISALMPASFFEKDGSLKNQEDTGQIGAHARGIGSMLKIWNSVNRGRCSIHLISQIRKDLGQMHASSIVMGGEAIKFYSSVMIKLWSTANDAKQIKSNKKVGGRTVTTNIGREVTWVIDYSKISEPNMSGSYNMYYRGSEIGIDSTAEIVGLAKRMGIMEQSGSWLKYGGESKYERDWNAEIKENEVLRKELTEAIELG